MRFLEIRFRVKSPAIVTRRRSERGFKSSLDSIPGSTLRGALLSSLFYQGRVSRENLEKERNDPSLICTPAYPVVKDEKSWPSHPFVFRCKATHQLVLNKAGEVIEDLEAGRTPAIPIVCPEGHAALESLHPKLIDSKGNLVAPESFSSICVGINKNRASFEGGMLYEYDAIAAGETLWAMLACSGDTEIDKGFEFWVGRGISRGFGHMEVTQVEDLKLEEKARQARDAIKNGRIVLYSLSPLVSVEDGSCRAYPEMIDLSWVARKLSLQGGGKMEVEVVYGKQPRMTLAGIS